jgi:energy-coupling factor transporter ATP-binding protein EcfA2
MSSILFIGKNGAGKSTIAYSLEVFQKIGRGSNRVHSLVQRSDFSGSRTGIPMRFELEVSLDGILYKYTLAFELPEKFKELRVLEEQLLADEKPVFKRNGAVVTLNSKKPHVQFSVDWHLVALPVIQEQSETDPLFIFKQWLGRMIILAPIPQLMIGESADETLEPARNGSNLGDWLSGLLGRYPAAYTMIIGFLRQVMPDIQDFLNESTGKETKNLVVRYEAKIEKNPTLNVDFKQLSDGEKCFFLGAIIPAACEFYGPLFCFWDEPDNYFSLPEVGNFVNSLRRYFQKSNQIFITSHNAEAIRKFSDIEP